MTSSVVKLLFYFYLFNFFCTILLGRENMTIAGGTVRHLWSGNVHRIRLTQRKNWKEMKTKQKNTKEQNKAETNKKQEKNEDKKHSGRKETLKWGIKEAKWQKRKETKSQKEITEAEKNEAKRRRKKEK